MKDAVDVVEQVFLVDLLAWISCLKVSHAGIGYGIAAAQATFSRLSKEIIFSGLGGFVVEVKREALRAAICLLFRMRPGITPCVIKVAATYAVAIDRSHSPAASAGA